MAICVGALINEIHPFVFWGRFVCVRFPAQEKAGLIVRARRGAGCCGVVVPVG